MEAAQQPKRRRVAVACDGCRRRKIRCDGQEPCCTYCLDHDLSCVYQKTSQRVQVSQAYLNSLLRQVEDLQRSSPQSNSELQQSSTSDAVDDIIPSPQFVEGQDPNDEGNEEFSTDAMVCAGPSPRVGGGYFGNSSTVAFLEVLQTIAFRNGTAMIKGMPPSPRADEFPVSSLPNFKTPLLPPRSTADHLVDTYFTRVSDLYTILHEPSFRARYEQLWQPGPEEPDRLWLCILNAVFALGSLFSDQLPAEDSEATALSFFAQAKELLNFDCLDSGSLTMVQALLLMGQYLQSTTQVNRCWYVFGLAIRTAQGLGLQLAEANQRCPPLERELRKRCWCGCLIMDTMVAMTFGRPLMIPSEHYEAVVDNDDEMPAQVDDACITPTQIFAQPKHTPPPRILLFIHKAKLYVVLHRILKALYQGKGEASFSGGEMLQFDQQLCAWKDKLPPCLRLDDSPWDGLDSFSLRQRHILHARYLTVRVLLTRPSLAAVAQMTTISSSTNQDSGYHRLRPLHDAFALTAAESCIDTAIQLIEHIQQNIIIDGHLLGASWYNTYSVFSAGLVLFAAQMFPTLRRENPPTVSWQAGMEIMKALSLRCSAARTCHSILDLFEKHLQGIYSKNIITDRICICMRT
jgi:Fungal specific transcription factor domain/Fungal Zn(2)-Cys(6) binuclear cluster domain